MGKQYVLLMTFLFKKIRLFQDDDFVPMSGRVKVEGKAARHQKYTMFKIFIGCYIYNIQKTFCSNTFFVLVLVLLVLLVLSLFNLLHHLLNHFLLLLIVLLLIKNLKKGRGGGYPESNKYKCLIYSFLCCMLMVLSRRGVYVYIFLFINIIFLSVKYCGGKTRSTRTRTKNVFEQNVF